MNKAKLRKTIYRKQFIWFSGNGYYHWNHKKSHWYKIPSEDKDKYQIVKVFTINDVIEL